MDKQVSQVVGGSVIIFDRKHSHFCEHIIIRIILYEECKLSTEYGSWTCKQNANSERFLYCWIRISYKKEVQKFKLTLSLRIQLMNLYTVDNYNTGSVY